jgi:hypothetical protein
MLTDFVVIILGYLGHQLFGDWRILKAEHCEFPLQLVEEDVARDIFSDQSSTLEAISRWKDKLWNIRQLVFSGQLEHDLVERQIL